MSEWLKEHAWKACVLERVPRVRIPLSPPVFHNAFVVMIPSATRVGPRTVEPCEPRQVRKEAAAAGVGALRICSARVAVFLTVKKIVG